MNDHRPNIGQSLPTSSFGNPNDISPRQGSWQCNCLYGRWLLKLILDDKFIEFLIKVEMSKTDYWSWYIWSCNFDFQLFPELFVSNTCTSLLTAMRDSWSISVTHRNSCQTLLAKLSRSRMVLNFILSSFTFLIRGVHFINWKVFNHLILILGVVNYWTDMTPPHRFHYLHVVCK